MARRIASGSTRRRLRAAASPAGWTIIELVVVIAIIVVLAGIALTNYTHAVRRAQEAVLREDLFRLRDAIDQYYADKAKYPASLEDLVTDGYLRRVPEDPFTRSAETWQTVTADADFTNPDPETGISDVKSGSDRISLDGNPYSDW